MNAEKVANTKNRDQETRGLIINQIPEPSEQDIKDVSFEEKKVSPLIQEELEFELADMEKLLKITESQKVVFETATTAIEEGRHVL